MVSVSVRKAKRSLHLTSAMLNGNLNHVAAVIVQFAWMACAASRKINCAMRCMIGAWVACEPLQKNEFVTVVLTPTVFQFMRLFLVDFCRQ